MPSSHTQLLNYLRKNWHYLYFLLAAIDIIALAITLVHSRKNFVAYDNLVKENAYHLSNLELHGKLAESARKVNAPGNDIFESKNASLESERFLTALSEFNHNLKRIEATKEDPRLSPEASVDQLRAIERVKSNYLRMQQEGAKIFFVAIENRMGMAAVHMAEMDRAYGELLNSIEDLRSRQLKLQEESIRLNQVALRDSRHFENSFSFILLLSVLGVSYYGSRLSKFIRTSQEQDNRFRQIYQALNASAIVARTDKAGNILEVNENFCTVSGYQEQELLGKNHRIISSNTHPKEFFQALWKTITSGNVWTGSIQNRKKSGALYTVNTVISPIRNTENKITEYFSIRFDITDQVRIKKELQDAQEIAKIGSWKFDRTNRDLSWSEENYRIFEIGQSQVGTDLFAEYLNSVHQEDRVKLKEKFLPPPNQLEDFTIDHRVTLQDGKRTKYVRCIGKIVRDTSGSPLHIAGTNQDLTELIFTQEKLRSSLDFNRAILKNAKHSIITTDLDGIITAFNQEAERILEYTAEEMVGKCSPGIFHDPNEIEIAAANLSAELGVKVPVGFETFVAKAKIGLHDERVWTYINKSGRRIPVRLSVTALKDNEGKVNGYMGIGRDISEFLEIQKNLNFERARATHASKLASLGEVSAGIAHEINNPLAIIAGNLNLMQRFKDDPKKFAEKVETITKSVSRIEKIVKSLKRFSRSTHGSSHKLESLSKIISESLVLTESKTKKLEITIKSEVTGDPHIICDQVEIEQVLVNLISNAADAVKNCEERWIEISCAKEGSEIIVRVKDSGTGISALTEEKLFQPFFTTKPVGEGTGLGLSISKGIMEDHGAQIGLDKSFKNTCFELRFPEPSNKGQNAEDVA